MVGEQPVEAEPTGRLERVRPAGPGPPGCRASPRPCAFPRELAPGQRPGRNGVVTADHGDVHARCAQRRNTAAHGRHLPAAVRRGRLPGEGHGRPRRCGRESRAFRSLPTSMNRMITLGVGFGQGPKARDSRPGAVFTAQASAATARLAMRRAPRLHAAHRVPGWRPGDRPSAGPSPPPDDRDVYDPDAWRGGTCAASRNGGASGPAELRADRPGPRPPRPGWRPRRWPPSAARSRCMRRAPTPAGASGRCATRS
jgi:hypothetical protein